MLKVTDSRYAAKLRNITRLPSTPAEVVNSWAMLGFQILGDQGKVAVPEIIDILQRHLSESSQNCCADALGDIGPAAKSALPTLVRYIRGTNGNLALRLHSLNSLAHIDGQSEVTISILESSAHDNNVHVQKLAVGCLGRAGPSAASALPFLLTLSTNNRSPVRNSAIAAVGNIRTSPEIEVKNLILCLEDSDSNVRAAAAESLGMFKTDALAARHALTDMLGDANPQCQIAAKEALAHIQ
jgi:HEAT repeat protein